MALRVIRAKRLRKVYNLRRLKWKLYTVTYQRYLCTVFVCLFVLRTIERVLGAWYIAPLEMSFTLKKSFPTLTSLPWFHRYYQGKRLSREAKVRTSLKWPFVCRCLHFTRSLITLTLVVFKCCLYRLIVGEIIAVRICNVVFALS